MKPLFVLTLALLFSVSKSTAQDPHEGQFPEISESNHKENVKSLSAIYDAFATGNGRVLQELISDDVIWNEAESFPYADRNPYIGKKAVFEGVFGRIATEWESFKLTGIRIYPMLDDRVLATGFYEGSHKKTKRVVKIQMAHLCLFKDGKLVEFQQFADTKKAALAIAD